MSYASLFAPSPLLGLPCEIWDGIFSFSHGEEKDQIYKKVFSVQRKENKVDSVLPRQNRSMKQNKLLPRQEDLEIEVEVKERVKAPRTKRRHPIFKVVTKPGYPPKKRIIKQKKIISHEEELYRESIENPHDYITDGPDDNFCDDYYDDLYNDRMSHYLHDEDEGDLYSLL